MNDLCVLEKKLVNIVYLTSIRSLGGMYSPMLAEGRQLSEAFPTRVTVEVPLIGVGRQVSH